MIKDLIARNRSYRRFYQEAVPMAKGADGSIKTYVDSSGVRHVPKRSLSELIVSEFGD